MVKAEEDRHVSPTAPKVFVSHASEDKDRFVRVFAERLRAKGVDAWVDEWEIYPGDSLIDKIFEEGLKDASVVIVVISRFSVEKPWVREELNASVVKRIDRGGRLIPVILDNTAVPEVLKNTVWVNVPDVNSYDKEFDRVVSSIFGYRPKPPVGEAPRYISASPGGIAGLSDVDTIVLRVFCVKAIEKNSTLAVSTAETWEVVSKSDVSREDFEDALEVLENKGYLEPSAALAPIPAWFSITVPGMEAYLRRFDPSYPSTFREVGLAVLNGGLENNYEIANAVNQPAVMVNHVLHVMTMKRYVKTSQMMGGSIDIFEIGAELKRFLRQES